MKTKPAADHNMYIYIIISFQSIFFLSTLSKIFFIIPAIN